MELSIRKSCRECGSTMETFDGWWQHPFTCIVAGPSGSGKSTFVRRLMLAQEKIIDVRFDYVYVFIGTDVAQNRILSRLKADLSPMTDVRVIEIFKMFPTRKEMIEEFPTRLKAMLVNLHENGKKGCVIFDDLMKELGEMGILLDLFTKISSHYSTSVVHITQNLFHKGSGKHSSDHVGVYRNSHITVLFHNPLDNHPLWTVASRLVRKGSGPLCRMLEEIVEKHRYVVIHGGMNWPKKLRFMTDLFGRSENGVQRQTVYEFVAGD